jgi:hypothetical protein
MAIHAALDSDHRPLHKCAEIMRREIDALLESVSSGPGSSEQLKRFSSVRRENDSGKLAHVEAALAHLAAETPTSAAGTHDSLGPIAPLHLSPKTLARLTDLWALALPGSERTELLAMNTELRRAILDMRAQDLTSRHPTLKRGVASIEDWDAKMINEEKTVRSEAGAEVTNNRGGWQSRWRSHFPRSLHSFHKLCAPHGSPQAEAAMGCWAWKRLQVHIYEQVRVYLAKHSGLYDGGEAFKGKDGDVGISIQEVWSMVNESGDWNERHAHGGSSVSGCYYVAGSGTAPNFLDVARDYGRHDLRYHRRFGSNEHDTGIAGWGGAPRRYVPRAVRGSGKSFTMLLFPGFVEHETVVNIGDELRIAVCFNIQLTASKERKRRPREGHGWWRPAFSVRESFLAPIRR